MEEILAIDIGGTQVKHALIDRQGNLRSKGSYDTINDKTSFLSAITKLIEGHIERDSIKGVAFSCPGLIDSKNGHLITAGALTSLNDFNLVDHIKQEFHIQASVENDVNCAALAEQWKGNGTDCEDFICLTVGTGIGGAVVINNKLYRGKNNMAGEFGFMFVKDIEQNHYSQAISSSQASTRGGLINRYRSLTDETLSGEDICKLASKEDKAATETIDQFTHYLAVTVYNLAFAFDPQIVLIGGGISANSEIIEKTRTKVATFFIEQPYLKQMTIPEIQACALHNDAGFIGAAKCYFDRYK